jgi:sugar lactone lactonase YvrE
MVLPLAPGRMIPRRGRRILSLICLWLLAPSGAAAAEKWVAERKLEISGSGGMTFNQPVDATVVEEGLLVLDALNNRLCWFDLKGRPTGITGGTAEFPLSGAMTVAPDSRGGVLVGDSFRGRVLRATRKGGFTVVVTLVAQDKEQPADPTGLLYFGEKIYLVDNDNHVVRIFAADGKPEGKWGGIGRSLGQFQYPFRLAADPRGRIAVTDVLNCRIQFFTPKGELLSSFGRAGSTAGTLFRPGGFDIDQEGNVWVADNYFGTVQVFSQEGALKAVLHGIDGGVLALRSPVALKVRRGSLYVVEMGANRVVEYSIRR